MIKQNIVPARRVKKTKKAIKSALADLLVEKEMSQITVKELADKADINRNTFYGHYQAISEVITEIETEIILNVVDIINNTDYINSKYNPYMILEKLTMLINDNYEFYSKLIKADSTSNLISRIKNTLRDNLIEELSSVNKHNRHNLNIVVEFACSGTFAVYQEWFNSSESISIESISQELSKLSVACMNCLESEI